MTKKEEMLNMRDGARVHLTVFMPDCKSYLVRGVVLMIHGFGEHANRYECLAARFSKKDFAFFAPDMRGHGKTPGRRGVVKSGYDSFLSDIDEIRTKIKHEYPGRPVILYGHSMGGNIALNYILGDRDLSNIHCVIAGSPWLGLELKAESLIQGGTWLISNFAPGLTAKIHLPLDKLTRDESSVEDVKHDEAYHSSISMRLFREVTSHGNLAKRRAGLVTLPTFVLIAGDDKIVSSAATREFCSRASDKVVMKEYPGAFHELHNEINAAEIFDDVWQFIARWV